MFYLYREARVFIQFALMYPQAKLCAAPIFFTSESGRVCRLSLQPPFQQQLKQAAEGSSQLSIRRPVMESLTIMLPSMADQRRIVSVVELAQRERQVLLQLIQNRDLQLEALSEKLFKASASPT